MPTLSPVDESFLASAPTRFERTWDVARPAADVWAELVGDKPLHWARGLDISWTSSRPFGVGTTRRASVLGLISVEEYFFVWEEGRRYAFYGTAMNLPLFARIAEDYVVDPVDAGRCRFTWTAAIEPSTVGKVGAPVNKALFSSLFADTGRHFGAA